MKQIKIRRGEKKGETQISMFTRVFKVNKRELSPNFHLAPISLSPPPPIFDKNYGSANGMYISINI